MAEIKLYNTLSRSKEIFKPIEQGKVKMYHCGPTVYSHQHIGNMYSSLFADSLRRMFEYLGYTVTQVMNITDVGHLVSDGDAGEDKMEKGAKKFGKTVWEVAEYYTKLFLQDTQKLNIKEPNFRPKATQFIQEIIELNKKLVEHGYAYETDEALYFDVTKMDSYGKLSGQNLKEKKEGVREDVYVDPKKRNPADFALWFKRVGRFENHTMHWNSPWGDGFPGWHIECSAMSKKYLGETFDIHTGGIEHIPVHHTNEIAQSESANQTEFVHYWLHHQLILVDGQKMSKSIGNIFTLDDLEAKGFNPLAFRLLALQSKYREQLNFTFSSLEAAQNSYDSIKKQIRDLKTELINQKIDLQSIQAEKQKNSYQLEFEEAIADDLNTAVALAVFFKLLKDKSINTEIKLKQILSFDEVFGLMLDAIQPLIETEELIQLKEEWKKAREEKKWEVADVLRVKIAELENDQASG